MVGTHALCTNDNSLQVEPFVVYPPRQMQRLTTGQKKTILSRIADLDPKNEIVTLSPNAAFSGGTISYNKDCGIALHETIRRLTDEEYVRAYLVVRLIKQLRY